LNLPPMTFLFMEGDPGEQMYIIRKGLVRILKREGSHMATLAELGPGSILGEMSLLDRQPRSATAKTLENTEVVIIDQAMLEATYQKLPSWLTAIIRMVVQRLRETTARRYLDDIRNSIPCLLFILDSQYNAKTRMVVPKLADQLKTLYGLSYNDFHKSLQVLAKFGLVKIEPSSSGQEHLDVMKPMQLRYCYKHFLDQASPKPTNEYAISNEEAKALQSLLNAAKVGANMHGDKVLVAFTNVREDLQNNAPELVAAPQHWLNLCLAQRIEVVPTLQQDQNIGDEHQIAFVENHVESLVSLHQIIPALTDHFLESIQATQGTSGE